ncbi:MAG: hypothetical protein ACE5JI_09510 [Acidobacteriota bacterium]
MRRLFTVFAFVVSFGVLASPAISQKYPTISYRDAAEHVDEIVYVTGTVLRTEKGSEGTYLLFSARPKYLRVLIPRENLKNFKGSLQYMYAGKKIKVVGKITRYGRKLILGVNEPKRIEILKKKAS